MATRVGQVMTWLSQKCEFSISASDFLLFGLAERSETALETALKKQEPPPKKTKKTKTKAKQNNAARIY